MSVFLRPERPSRDRRLTRARIVARAVEVLDAEGGRGLSMRRVASELGVTAGSLYWYVATKSELIELAHDEVLGEVLDAVRTDVTRGDWRAEVGGLARANRAMLRRHPWVLAGLADLPALGPNALALAEAGLAALDRAGFTGPAGDAALAAVNDQVVGAVVAETAWRASLAHAGDADAREVGEHFRRVAGEHPHLAARADMPGEVDVTAECERRFAFALDCLLDGLAARRD
ncbi:TetR/AcrR family transcriptional regulator [Actinomadura sp. LOL_016]|uniref:TetR/AcrR family transcriptional regulator n=1 Tax=unclassified Actinomadura TaxID=2626254 RepID=UPI003A7F8CCB